MRHAKSILSQRFPVVQYAGKRVVRIPTDRSRRRLNPDAPLIFTASEDLFNGCFDACGLNADGVLCVQVTSQTASRSSVADRKRKIERLFLHHFPTALPVTVELWSWVNRRGFRVFRWDHPTRQWIECDGLMKPSDFSSGG